MLSLKKQVDTIQANLQKVEADKVFLEQELVTLRKKQITERADQRYDDGLGVDEEGTFLREKISDMQEDLDKQFNTIQSLHDELTNSKSEVENLRDELIKKLRRIVALECDLEAHEINFTKYSEEQFKLGEEAFQEIKTTLEKAKSEGGGAFVTDPKAAKKLLVVKRSQKLISKLLSEMDNLESRYKDEKLNNATAMEQIQSENEKLHTKILVLEQRLEQAANETKTRGQGEGIREKRELLDEAAVASMTTSLNNSLSAGNTFVLQKQVETLEAKRTFLMNALHHFQNQLDVAKETAATAECRYKTEVRGLTLERDAMKLRIRILESSFLDDDEKDGKDGKKDIRASQFDKIEREIREKCKEVANLQATNEIKDKQIALLKKELTEIRIKTIASGDAEAQEGKTSFSDFDVELLGSAEKQKHENKTMMFIEDGASNLDDFPDYVKQLQQQLQLAHQQLAKKERDLIIERAKSASTAASLMGRITELTNDDASEGGKDAEEAEEAAEIEEEREELKVVGIAPEEETKAKKKKKKRRFMPLRFYL
jgi:hypothetical protein